MTVAGTGATGVPVAAFLRQLADERQLSPHTVSAYRKDLADLQSFLTGYLGSSDWSWEDVDRLTLRGFLAWCTRKGLSRRTVARKLSATRAFFRYLHIEDLLPANPTRAVRTPRARATVAWSSRSRRGDVALSTGGGRSVEEHAGWHPRPGDLRAPLRQRAPALRASRAQHAGDWTWSGTR